jgi:hypothetical protein
MQHLDDVYNEIIINEKLKVINLDPDMVRQELEKQYSASGQQSDNISYKKRFNEENEVVNILNNLYSFDQRYTKAFLKFKENPKLLTKEIVMIDNNWKMFNEGTLQRYLKQASKLVFINLLNKMGLNIKVDVNEFGYPVYKLHFLHRFIQMNILSQLFNNKMIDAETKSKIESIIFDNNTRSQLEKEIKKYQSDVTKTGDISEAPTNDDETSDVEPASFTPPDKADRLETIKRLVKK